jgi:hypothetical protein
MYLRITRGKFDPAKYEALMPVFADVVAAIRQLPGNQGIQTGIDRASGKTATATTFDTLEHAQFQRTSLGAAFAALQASGWQGEPPEIYELWT